MILPSKPALLVTTGDPDGVGFEVAAKAILALPKIFFTNSNVCVFVTPFFQKRYFALLAKRFTIVSLRLSTSDFLLEGLKTQLSKTSKPLLHIIFAKDSPADWIFHLSKICLNFPLSAALVTGPLSKTLIKDAGYSAIGHTEILAQVSKSAPLYMGFVGKYFSVVLLTGHIPIRDVSSALKLLDWKKTSVIVHEFIRGLKQKHLPVGLLGLNPHAGEKGMISGGEDQYLTEKILQLNSMKQTPKFEGPLVPDAAFLKANWKRYSVYLATYHDQGLIPFKTIHGQDSGVHVTLGLPFVRTSVDHGTAKDLFGKNLANPNSMKEALVLAFNLLNKKTKLP